MTNRVLGGVIGACAVCVGWIALDGALAAWRALVGPGVGAESTSVVLGLGASLLACVVHAGARKLSGSVRRASRRWTAQWALTSVVWLALIVEPELALLIHPIALLGQALILGVIAPLALSPAGMQVE